jgi:hypothetical protein
MRRRFALSNRSAAPKFPGVYHEVALDGGAPIIGAGSLRWSASVQRTRDDEWAFPDIDWR